jgi:hypothetical protein
MDPPLGKLKAMTLRRAMRRMFLTRQRSGLPGPSLTNGCDERDEPPLPPPGPAAPPPPKTTLCRACPSLRPQPTQSPRRRSVPSEPRAARPAAAAAYG